MNIKTFIKYTALSLIALLLWACADDEHFTASIFDIEDQLDESAASYAFDSW